MRVACFVSVLGVLAACGGDEGVSINATADNFCDEIAEVACHNIYQCCTEGEIEDFLGVSEPRTEAQCREDVARSCVRYASAYYDSIDAGRLTVDTQRLNDCLNAIVAPEGTCASVETETPWRTACMQSAFLGTVAVGGACFFNHDCQGAPDSFCAPDQKCAAKPTAGFPCMNGTCASQFYCGTGNICQPRVAVGAPCTSASQCAESLYCDFNAQPMPVCAMKEPGGAACTGNEGCISGTCIPGRCMNTNNICYQDSHCSSRCANNPNISCTTAAQCGTGNCSVGGNSCTSDLSCTAGGTDVCVFPVQCVPGDCVGDPICTAAQVQVDYCTQTTAALPVL